MFNEKLNRSIEKLKQLKLIDQKRVQLLINKCISLQQQNKNKVYTIKELENVLQTHDLDKIEYYFNQFSYLKTQRRDVIELLKQYIDNEAKLNIIVEYGNKYKGEHLHFLLGMCKIQS